MISQIALTIVKKQPQAKQDYGATDHLIKHGINATFPAAMKGEDN